MFAWLRDGGAIAGESRTTYVVHDADAGHTIACRVTATNVGGSAAATSGAVRIRRPLENATSSQIATAFGLRSNERCVGGDRFTVRLHDADGVGIKSARVFFNGDPVPVREKGSKWVARISLRRYDRKRFTVTIKVKTDDKRTLTGKRTYRVC